MLAPESDSLERFKRLCARAKTRLAGDESPPLKEATEQGGMMFVLGGTQESNWPDDDMVFVKQTFTDTFDDGDGDQARWEPQNTPGVVISSPFVIDAEAKQGGGYSHRLRGLRVP